MGVQTAAARGNLLEPLPSHSILAVVDVVGLPIRHFTQSQEPIVRVSLGPVRIAKGGISHRLLRLGGEIDAIAEHLPVDDNIGRPEQQPSTEDVPPVLRPGAMPEQLLDKAAAFALQEALEFIYCGLVFHSPGLV